LFRQAEFHPYAQARARSCRTRQRGRGPSGGPRDDILAQARPGQPAPARGRT
jgi:hypothetical protein